MGLGIHEDDKKKLIDQQYNAMLTDKRYTDQFNRINDSSSDSVGAILNYQGVKNWKKLGFSSESDARKDFRETTRRAFLYNAATGAVDALDKAYKNNLGKADAVKLANNYLDSLASGLYTGNESAIRQSISNLSRADKEGVAYIPTVEGGKLTDGVATGVDIGNAWNQFMAIAGKNLGVLNIVTKIAAGDGVTGKSYKSAALQENFRSLDKEEQIIDGWASRLIANAASYTTPILEAYMVGKLGGKKYGMPTLLANNVLRGALGDWQYNAGTSDPLTAEKFVTGRIFDTATGFVSMAMSDVLVNKIGGYMPGKFLQTGFVRGLERVIKKGQIAGFYQMAAHNVVNIGANTLFDYSTDWLVYNGSTLLGADYIAGTDAAFNVNDAVNRIKQAKLLEGREATSGDIVAGMAKEIFSQLGIRAATSIGSSVVRRIAGKALSGETNEDLLSRKWYDYAEKQEIIPLTVQKSVGYRASKVIANFTYHMYPHAVGNIDSVLRSNAKLSTETNALGLIGFINNYSGAKNPTDNDALATSLSYLFVTQELATNSFLKMMAGAIDKDKGTAFSRYWMTGIDHEHYQKMKYILSDKGDADQRDLLNSFAEISDVNKLTINKKNITPFFDKAKAYLSDVFTDDKIAKENKASELRKRAQEVIDLSSKVLKPEDIDRETRASFLEGFNQVKLHAVTKLYEGLDSKPWSSYTDGERQIAGELDKLSPSEVVDLNQSKFTTSVLKEGLLKLVNADGSNNQNNSFIGNFKKTIESYKDQYKLDSRVFTGILKNDDNAKMYDVFLDQMGLKAADVDELVKDLTSLQSVIAKEEVSGSDSRESFGIASDTVKRLKNVVGKYIEYEATVIESILQSQQGKVFDVSKENALVYHLRKYATAKTMFGPRIESYSNSNILEREARIINHALKHKAVVLEAMRKSLKLNSTESASLSDVSEFFSQINNYISSIKGIKTMIVNDGDNVYTLTDDIAVKDYEAFAKANASSHIPLYNTHHNTAIINKETVELGTVNDTIRGSLFNLSLNENVDSVILNSDRSTNQYAAHFVRQALDKEFVRTGSTDKAIANVRESLGGHNSVIKINEYDAKGKLDISIDNTNKQDLAKTLTGLSINVVGLDIVNKGLSDSIVEAITDVNSYQFGDINVRGKSETVDDVSSAMKSVPGFLSKAHLALATLPKDSTIDQARTVVKDLMTKEASLHKYINSSYSNGNEGDTTTAAIDLAIKEVYNLRNIEASFSFKNTTDYVEFTSAWATIGNKHIGDGYLFASIGSEDTAQDAKNAIYKKLESVGFIELTPSGATGTQKNYLYIPKLSSDSDQTYKNKVFDVYKQINTNALGSIVGPSLMNKASENGRFSFDRLVKILDDSSSGYSKTDKDFIKNSFPYKAFEAMNDDSVKASMNIKDFNSSLIKAIHSKFDSGMLTSIRDSIAGNTKFKKKLEVNSKTTDIDKEISDVKKAIDYLIKEGTEKGFLSDGVQNTSSNKQVNNQSVDDNKSKSVTDKINALKYAYANPESATDINNVEKHNKAMKNGRFLSEEDVSELIGQTVKLQRMPLISIDDDGNITIIKGYIVKIGYDNTGIWTDTLLSDDAIVKYATDKGYLKNEDIGENVNVETDSKVLQVETPEVDLGAKRYHEEMLSEQKNRLAKLIADRDKIIAADSYSLNERIRDLDILKTNQPRKEFYPKPNDIDNIITDIDKSIDNIKSKYVASDAITAITKIMNLKRDLILSGSSDMKLLSNGEGKLERDGNAAASLVLLKADLEVLKQTLQALSGVSVVVSNEKALDFINKYNQIKQKYLSLAKENPDMLSVYNKFVSTFEAGLESNKDYEFMKTVYTALVTEGAIDTLDDKVRSDFKAGLEKVKGNSILNVEFLDSAIRLLTPTTESNVRMTEYENINKFVKEFNVDELIKKQLEMEKEISNSDANRGISTMVSLFASSGLREDSNNYKFIKRANSSSVMSAHSYTNLSALSANVARGLKELSKDGSNKLYIHFYDHGQMKSIYPALSDGSGSMTAELFKRFFPMLSGQRSSSSKITSSFGGGLFKICLDEDSEELYYAVGLDDSDKRHNHIIMPIDNAKYLPVNLREYVNNSGEIVYGKNGAKIIKVAIDIPDGDNKPSAIFDSFVSSFALHQTIKEGTIETSASSQISINPYSLWLSYKDPNNNLHDDLVKARADFLDKLDRGEQLSGSMILNSFNSKIRQADQTTGTYATIGNLTRGGITRRAKKGDGVSLYTDINNTNSSYDLNEGVFNDNLMSINIATLAREIIAIAKKNKTVIDKKTVGIAESIVGKHADVTSKLDKDTLNKRAIEFLDVLSKEEIGYFAKVTTGTKDKPAYVRLFNRSSNDGQLHYFPIVVAEIRNVNTNTGIMISGKAAHWQSADFDGDTAVTSRISRTGIDKMLKSGLGSLGIAIDSNEYKTNTLKYLTMYGNRLSDLEDLIYSGDSFKYKGDSQLIDHGTAAKGGEIIASFSRFIEGLQIFLATNHSKFSNEFLTKDVSFERTSFNRLSTATSDPKLSVNIGNYNQKLNVVNPNRIMMYTEGKGGMFDLNVSSLGFDIVSGVTIGNQKILNLTNGSKNMVAIVESNTDSLGLNVLGYKIVSDESDVFTAMRTATEIVKKYNQTEDIKQNLMNIDFVDGKENQITSLIYMYKKFSSSFVDNPGTNFAKRLSELLNSKDFDELTSAIHKSLATVVSASAFNANLDSDKYLKMPSYYSESIKYANDTYGNGSESESTYIKTKFDNSSMEAVNALSNELTDLVSLTKGVKKSLSSDTDSINEYADKLDNILTNSADKTQILPTYIRVLADIKRTFGSAASVELVGVPQSRLSDTLVKHLNEKYGKGSFLSIFDKGLITANANIRKMQTILDKLSSVYSINNVHSISDFRKRISNKTSTFLSENIKDLDGLVSTVYRNAIKEYGGSINLTEEAVRTELRALGIGVGDENTDRHSIVKHLSPTPFETNFKKSDLIDRFKVRAVIDSNGGRLSAQELYVSMNKRMSTQRTSADKNTLKAIYSQLVNMFDNDTNAMISLMSDGVNSTSLSLISKYTTVETDGTLGYRFKIDGEDPSKDDIFLKPLFVNQSVDNKIIFDSIGNRLGC